MNNLRIVFMGTPEFAVPSLEILLLHHFEVVAVITGPDKLQGRGQVLTPSPVKACALKYHVPVLQPTNLKAPDFLETLKSYHANLQIVVAFRMLPEAVWAMPSLGTFNLHASLLPDYRGAAPINWAIMNGEKVTGITTFFLRHEIDTGSIVFQESEPIHATDDAGSLYARLMSKGGQLVLKTVKAIQSGDYRSVPQQTPQVIRHAPKIFKDTCKISWDQPTEAIRNFVRGLSPYPAAWTVLNGKNFKIYHLSVPSVSDSIVALPGAINTDNKNYLYVCVNDGWVSIEELQAEGKKRMDIKEFFRGNKL
jgi:methionyl-tRNA formyltransferase